MVEESDRLKWYDLNGCKSALGETFGELERVVASTHPVTHERRSPQLPESRLGLFSLTGTSGTAKTTNQIVETIAIHFRTR